MNPRWWRFEPVACAGLSLMAVGAALVSQHVFDMQPCPWCVLQRLVFVLLALMGLVEWAAGSVRPVRHAGAALRLALALAGLASAAWQHLVASASASCNLTLADRLVALTGLDGWLPEIFQPRASCLEAKAWLLGLPYEFWSAGLFALLAAGAVRTLLDGRFTVTR